MVVPSGLTTNAYERPLWDSLVKPGYVVSVIDFENKNALFPGVHRMAKFSLLALSRKVQVAFQTGCWLHEVGETRDPDRVMSLSVDELGHFSPDDLALPQFRSRAIWSCFGRQPGNMANLPPTMIGPIRRDSCFLRLMQSFSP